MKKTNKGFSLVELIIVIAIMAILAGAIAPALIKYIDKSRKSNDVTSAKAIKTAVETALGNEYIYEYLTEKGAVITIKPGEQCSADAVSENTGNKAVTVTPSGTPTAVKLPSGNTVNATYCAAEIAANIGEKAPRIKYKKKTDSIEPTNFYAVINTKGTITVGVGGASAPTITSSGTVSGMIVLSPDIHEKYQ